MSAIAPLTLADGQATPVNHTFNPVNVDSNGVAKWADRIGGIALGFPVVTVSLRQPTAASRNYKLVAKVVTPVLDISSPSTATGIQPAPSKAYDLTANIEFVLPERSTLQQRKDLMAYVKNFMANAAMVNAINDFESVY